MGNKTPRESIKNGFALVTEERRATGILGILDIRANTVIASLKKYLNGPFLSDKKMADATDSMIKAMRIKTPNQRPKSTRFPRQPAEGHFRPLDFDAAGRAAAGRADARH